MKRITELIANEALLSKSHEKLTSMKKPGVCLTNGDARIYTTSLYRKEETLYAVGVIPEGKYLFLASERNIDSAITGESFHADGVYLLRAEMTSENARALQKAFPFTEPVSLRDKQTTFGFGDRLGRATAGHIRAIAGFDAYPVFAQQSIRELTLTKRTYADVTADATFLVFQEGYEKGYGADGDHLKTLKDIDTALAAGMPMITLDLTEVMRPEVADWDNATIEKEFDSVPADMKERVENEYGDTTFTFAGEDVALPLLEAKKCALLYGDAIAFTKKVDNHLRANRGDAYDLEVSIDETTTPTLPAHHLFIIKELLVRKVTVNSLAPRFVGEFQKGIDYIGDIAEFERQFKIHAAIAKAHGDYKVSIHSGSDKLSVYPVIGKHTGLRLHAKTAGTSWLEAVRTIAKTEPSLYRMMHTKAFAYLEEALTLYHITADFSKIRPIDDVSDEELPLYLDHNEARQLLHITYGGLLNDPEVRAPFFAALATHEEEHYACLVAHLRKHLVALGIPSA